MVGTVVKYDAKCNFVPTDNSCNISFSRVNVQISNPRFLPALFVNDVHSGWTGIHHYRMAKIYCHKNQCNASMQYFAILHTDKYCTIQGKPIKLKIRSL